MNTNTSSINTRAQTAKATRCPVAYATLLNEGLLRAVEVSKTCINFAAEQNAAVLASHSKALNASPMPALFLFELAAQAFEFCVSFQKNLIDVAFEQSIAVIRATQEYSDNIVQTNAGSPDITQQSLDGAETSIQNRAPKQSETGSEAVKLQPGVTGMSVGALSHAMQRQFDALLAREIVELAIRSDVSGVPTETGPHILQLRVEIEEVVDLAGIPLKITDIN
jgi:hypothetical protein